MRAAEAAAIAAGTPVEMLMERAGAGAAEAIWRFAGPLPALVLCGPGNNGGDGYVIARLLRERGMQVRVAASGEPKTEAARCARGRWDGPVVDLPEAEPAPLTVDALFGTGLTRGLDLATSGNLARLAAEARIKVAIDLPSGVASDDGALLSPVPLFDLTVTFATLKPSHLLQPARARLGRIAIVDIGTAGQSLQREIGRPKLRRPGPQDHKYSRGYVAMVAGDMPGASALACAAAARSGAGYVRLFAERPVAGLPQAVVQHEGGGLAGLEDPRIDVVAIGPGLGRGEAALQRLDVALAAAKPLVLDADALVLLARRGVEALGALAETAILTPHAGEFARLFPGLEGGKLAQARAAASRSGCVIVYKGPDTVVAAPDGRAAIAGDLPPWLATAGTGDVLTGIVAALRAAGMEAFEAACAAVWLHGRAAERAGAGLVADVLLAHLPAALADCQ
jgi:hydroxyethylthiazole kinase-like uncharacterized protein yjeF